jgi:hypothetical protein
MLLHVVLYKSWQGMNSWNFTINFKNFGRKSLVLESEKKLNFNQPQCVLVGGNSFRMKSINRHHFSWYIKIGVKPI